MVDYLATSGDAVADVADTDGAGEPASAAYSYTIADASSQPALAKQTSKIG